MKLLITSVGSLLGQNILDALEQKRPYLEVIGIDASANSPRNFRCDKVYTIPLDSSPDYKKAFQQIIETIQPDFILPGRDGDSILLSELKKKNDDYYKNKVPFGTAYIPQIMIDKVKSFEFSKQYNLPFADSFYYKNEADHKGLKDFILKHGFPLLIKPKEGFGSHGVCYILNQDQLNVHIEKGAFLIQEFLGDEALILQYKNFYKTGIPLFFQVPEKTHYAAQTIIAPNGAISDVFFSINTMTHGRAEYIEPRSDKAVTDLVKNYCQVFYDHGWYGPVNFQLKKDKNDVWKVFEFNSRLTGTSAARFQLGYDEIGILTDLFVPEFNIPNFTKKELIKGKVFKYLTDYLLLDSDAEALDNLGEWKKS